MTRGMRTIDCDTHYWPIEFLERVDHPDKGRIEWVDDETVAYYRDGKLIHRFKTTRWDLSQRKTAMAEEGFDIQVLIPDNRPFLYELDRDLGNRMARAINDYSAEAVNGEDCFLPVSWLYLPDMEESVKELTRCVEELGIRAVKLTGGYGDCDLDEEAMWPLYEIAEHYDVPILVHPAARAFEDQFGHPWLVGGERFAPMRFLATQIGFPMTYMHCISRLIFSGVLDRFPKLRFGFFEGGCGWLPFLRKQLMMEAEHPSFERYQEEYGIRLQRHPGDYFDRLYVAATSYEDYLPDIVRRWPGHKLIIGSDFDHADPIATWPDTIRDLRAMEDIPAADQDAILGGNAMELLGLKAPVAA